MDNGSRVDVRNVLDVRLRSGRRVEYESPLVGGVSTSPAQDDNMRNVLDVRLRSGRRVEYRVHICGEV